MKASTSNYSSCHQPIKFGEALESRRWLILLTVCLVYISSAIGYLTFNATNKASMRYFHRTEESDILYFTDANLYCNLFLSSVGCWLAYKYFKHTVIFSAVFTSLACWIRYFAGPDYFITLLCQILIGLASVALFGFANVVPDRWFSTKERVAVNTISLFSNYLGWALGGLIPCIIVGDDESKFPENLLLQAYIITIPAILAVLVMKDKPKVPPSYSAMVKTEEKGYFEETKILFNSPKWIGASLCFGMVIGLSTSIPTTNSIYMDPLNLSYLNQGFITLGYVVTGLFTGFAATLYIENKGLKNCDFILKILLSVSFLSLVALGIMFVFVEKPDMLLILLCNCVLGIGFIGCMPFACSSIAESNFPIQEAVSTNGMNVLTMLFSIGASHLSVQKFVGKGGFLVLAGLMLPAWIYMMFFYETSFKRQEADEKHSGIIPEEEGANNSSLFDDEVKTRSTA